MTSNHEPYRLADALTQASNRPAEYPAINGLPVTERHAKACATSGHRVHLVDGVDTGVCPRCGEVTKPANA